MKIAFITADRGDRPEFLEHCRYQVSRQTVKGEHLVVDYPGIPGVVDIVPRIKHAVTILKENKFDFAFIIENDDYYPDNYAEKLLAQFSGKETLLGLDVTIYYSLQQKAWRCFYHSDRASLFCTAVNLKALDTYAWPEDDMLYFDRHLWQLGGTKKLISLNHPPIGMKHGMGFSPGNYHDGRCNGKTAIMNKDPKMKWLEHRTRPESFKFYKQLSEKL